MQPGLFFFPLYHTNEAVKDFNVLVTLTVYNRAFPDLDVVNQFLDDFPVKGPVKIYAQNCLQAPAE